MKGYKLLRRLAKETDNEEEKEELLRIAALIGPCTCWRCMGLNHDPYEDYKEE